MTEQEKVITFIQKQQGSRFRVLDNTGKNKKVVEGRFPDIIFMQNEPPPNNNMLFVLKVETDENLIDSVPEWKDLGESQSVFYIVVPEDKLDDAKKLASATEVKAKFAWYEMDGEDIKQVYYE